MEIIAELWNFVKTQKKWWLLPMLIILLLMSLLVVFASGSSIAPFIYTLF